ncbi:MAG TPA: glycosyltransferase [Burkholderiales bacterium]|nr:glycosyltransferase [Burkholderiales bacterium]
MSRKRVLISYFFGDDMIPLGESCAEAFGALGCEVARFNSQVESRWQPVLLKPVNRLARGLGYRGPEIGGGLPFSRVNFKRRMLMEAAASFRPRWILVIRAHEFVDAELVGALKRDYGVEKVVGWRVDGPLDTPDLLQDARIYDVYFCAHRYGYDPRADQIHPLPVYGMDLARYRNLYAAGGRPYNHEMVLVGGHNARREQLLGRLTDLPLEIYGKWGKRARHGSPLARLLQARGIWGEALLRLYNTSKIVLNITNWDPARYPALNQRVFDVPATGAFLLTDYSPELEAYFRLGEEIVTYRDVDELRDKARYYLAHDAERAAIARRGYERALTLPSIRDRMAEVVSVVEAG